MPGTEQPMGQSASSGSRGTQTDPTVKENLTFKYLEACCEGQCPQKDCSSDSFSPPSSPDGPVCPAEPVRSLTHPCGAAPPCASPPGGAVQPVCVAYMIKEARVGARQRAFPQGDQPGEGVPGGIGGGGGGGPVGSYGGSQCGSQAPSQAPSQRGMQMLMQPSGYSGPARPSCRKLECPSAKNAASHPSMRNEGPKISCPAVERALESAYSSAVCPLETTGVCPAASSTVQRGAGAVPVRGQICQTSTCPASADQASQTVWAQTGATQTSAARTCDRNTCPTGLDGASQAALSLHAPSGATSCATLAPSGVTQTGETQTCGVGSAQASMVGIALQVPSGSTSLKATMPPGMSCTASASSHHSGAPGSVGGGTGPGGGAGGGGPGAPSCPADQGQWPQARRPEKGYRCTGQTTCYKMNPKLLPLSPLAQMYLDMSSKVKHDWGDDPFKSDSPKGDEPSDGNEPNGRGAAKEERPINIQNRNKITLSFAKNIHPVIDVSLMNADGEEEEEEGSCQQCCSAPGACCTKNKCC